MKPANSMTDGQLQYAASDLRTAIAVTHPGRYSNMDRYIADYRSVITEQEARATKRAYRHGRNFGIDLLQHPIGKRQIIRRQHSQVYERQRARDANFSLGWMRIHQGRSITMETNTKTATKTECPNARFYWHTFNGVCDRCRTPTFACCVYCDAVLTDIPADEDIEFLCQSCATTRENLLTR